MKKFRSLKAFSLVEVLVSLLLVSILITAMSSVISKFSLSKTGLDPNSLTCIQNNASDIGFSSGIIAQPALGTSCYSAVNDCRYNKGKACNTIRWYADNGNASQQTAAKKMLRAACDLSGKVACNYFIEGCLLKGSTSSPYCKNNFFDITYYLQLPASNTIAGSSYIKNAIQNYYDNGNSIIVAEVNYDCGLSATSVACNVSTSKAYQTVQNCNAGVTSACTFGYQNNINRSCYQIRQAWPKATPGMYNLTPNGGGSPVSTLCDMTSTASAAITGCNAQNIYDCALGYTSSYNQSCAQIKTAWPGYDPTIGYRFSTNGSGGYTGSFTTCP